MKILIIGAGPTGLGAAWRLKELAHSDFLVIERNPFVGGLAASFVDSAGFTWDFAVHVAHSHYRYIDRLMQSVLPDGFLTHERRSWVYTQKTFVPFPFQYNFRYLPEKARQECLDGLVSRPPLTSNEPSNFEEWILATAGSGIAKHFMVPYNTKLWTVPPAAMNCRWLGDRVPETNLERVRRNIRHERDDVSWGPNHVFHFPRTGGTGSIWHSMARQIGPERIRLSAEAVAVDPASRSVRLSSGEILPYDHLISTLPLDRLVRMAGLDELAAPASRLQFSRVQVVCIGLPVPIPALMKDKTWIYCPDPESIYYRITPFSIFSPAHTPDAEHCCSFMCEVATPGQAPQHPEEKLAQRVLNDLDQSGLLKLPSAKPHVFHLSSDYAYPIPTLDRDSALAAILPRFEGINIWSRGRFGAWKYEVGNMDHSIMQGVEVVNRILRGEPESTLPDPAQVNSGKQ
ncbi:MAG: FAD-dependent oxidoreductase [Kiritimatiellae bacterium]|nr:FAD-dependent oxidoreductase [Kiritimatiellia bacterium]NLD90578.1 NAD(P)-binding protein [Lentisphaerota bacterium]HOU21292.1 FAD-dependent oxidoreductase [Kiritimatiellia bacterium]HPC19840.1 FAD-dependent oxidoreductase [Kiritimatiellia bacterium]HQN80084.1 FAD-dependent oxidoreductase [Kiritimatiellia bacterium]